ncbi:MAG TPA: type II toxin-antitoxin system VapC family toxin [Dissulfurispiraceae bacterium]|nr:type II toxin-antitoxin system VapC family toxin [Dissulfurispiraceae bacterium]
MMTGLDTNMLVRFFVMDDAHQAEKASSYIKGVITGGGSFFINLIVICELVWVLESAYSYRKLEIVGLLEKMLATRQFEIESKDIVRHAVNDYKNGSADFEDYLIGRANHHRGCSRTITFDRELKSSGMFEILR